MAVYQKRMKRREHPSHARFLTFSCRHRLPLFANPAIRDRFVDHLVGMARERNMRLFAWVVMPEHVHILLLPPPGQPAVGDTLALMKQRFATEILRHWRSLHAPILDRLSEPGGRTRFWQPGGGYDRNIYSDDELIVKAEYIHANPVRRGLVDHPTKWKWSSAYRPG